MDFRRLKLAGFKSFVEPAELVIEPGLTGIVGPNGCGKSNLLEALRWVMGETSARQLRGAGMEDVIFAGTATRPARAFAEVTLTATGAPEGALSGIGVSTGDIEVVRRIERGAGSAWRVNGRDVRARDVALVFADAATGATSPALVSQGRIAAVIAARPAERRAMLEEAAGIAGLHVRRREAETRLRATEANLARLADLMTGREGQIATLRRQARAAERYRAVSDRIKTAEARLIYARWREADGAADTARAAAQTAEAAVTAAQSVLGTAQARQAEVAAAAIIAREAWFTAREAVAAHEAARTALAARLTAARDRLAELDRDRKRLASDRDGATRTRDDAAAALARLIDEIAAADTALVADRARTQPLTAARDRAEAGVTSTEIAQGSAVAREAAATAEWRIAEAALATARARVARLDAERARHARDEALLAAEPDPAMAAANAETARAAAAAALAEALATRQRLATAREQAEAARDAAVAAQAAQRAELTALVREADALLRDRTARERAAATRGQRPGVLSACRVTPGCERALAAVLGRDATAPAGPAPGAGPVRAWTGAVAPAPLPDSLAHQVLAAPPELAARLALVRLAEADTGQALTPGEWLVTRAGHLRRWDGFVARGEGAAEAAQLEADNRLAGLETRRAPLEAAAATAEAEATAARTALAALAVEAGAAERAVSAAGDAERAALRALDSAEAARARRTARAADLARTGSALAEQREAAAGELAAAEAALAALPDPALARADLATARSAAATARATLQSAAAALAAHEQALAVANERLTAAHNQRRSWQTRAAEAEARLTAHATRTAELDAAHASVARDVPAREADLAAADTARQTLAAAAAAAEAKATAAASEADRAAAALASAGETLASARETRATAVARADNEDQRRRDSAALAGERFHCPPVLLGERHGFVLTDVGTASVEQAAHDTLLAERERLGVVNLVAAEELAAAEAEQAASQAEQAELTEAVNRLRGSIGHLNREGRERLRAAFTAVDGHFRSLFARLFGGGEARLALVDSDDPLEAGLEIYAQPPGKRLQSLSLLSGGEQALTAVALIFALFLTNPSPICVLDEVDAPLDDANIDRFCDLLDTMVTAASTRYLIVTHNAVTMSRMHRLFGVTMVEPGVSRLVSVDLSAATQLLENALPVG